MSRRRIRGLVTQLVPAALLAASGCASVPPAPPMAKDAIPESLYVSQPWALRPPVDIYRRLGAIQSAAASAQQALDTYSAALQEQAAQSARQEAREAEFRRNLLEQRDREAREHREALRREEAAARPKAGIAQPWPKAGLPASSPFPPDFGWQIGEATFDAMQGWTDASNRMMDVTEQRATNKALLQREKQRK